MIRTLVIVALAATGVAAVAAEQAPAKLDLEKAKNIAETVCVACHAADGNSVMPANPILAGQGAAYLLKQLNDFRAPEGKAPARNNPIMAGIASTLDAKDLPSLAAYFAQQKQKPSAAADHKLVEAGQTLWRKGDFERGIPACAGCHGPTGAGIPAQYPRLGGQYAEYTEAQLKNFRSEERSNDQEAVMRTIADKLSDKHIKAVADYIAGLR